MFDKDSRHNQNRHAASLMAAFSAVLCLPGCVQSPANSIACPSPVFIKKADQFTNGMERITSVSPRVVTKGNTDVTIETCTAFDAGFYNEAYKLRFFEEKISVVSPDGDTTILKQARKDSGQDAGSYLKTTFTFPAEIESGTYTVLTELLHDGSTVTSESTTVTVK